MDGNIVESVLGPMRMSNLGTTLTHEYVLSNFSNLYLESHSSSYSVPAQTYDFTLPSLRNFGYVRYYPYNNLYNLRLDDEYGLHATFDDIQCFKQANEGKATTIVEKSSCLNRNIDSLKSVSEKTQVNILIGTGYHIIDNTKKLLTCTTTIEEMYNHIKDEFENGCKNHTDVKPAFVADGGNILLDFEKRALRAIGEFQGQFRYPVSFHPGKEVIPLYEVMRIYQEAGGQPTEFVMAHIDRIFTSKEEFLEFVDDTKCYIQFDQFGVDSSFYQFDPFSDIMSDAQRIQFIALLKDNRKLERVLMSHDIHTKHRLLCFGGLGYAHINNNVVPRMLKRGFSRENIELIRILNPYRWLNRLNL